MIFSNTLRKLDYDDVKKSLIVMENHIRSMQEQLEYPLYHLDSANITSLHTDITDIVSTEGGINISGEMVSLKGSRGETVILGGTGGDFRIVLAGTGGSPAIYMGSDGRLVVGSSCEVHLDCGEWD